LIEADLKEADLSHAKLDQADLENTNMDRTNLSGADLRKALNLTCEQVESAVIDKKTRFPSYLEITWPYVGRHGANFLCKIRTPEQTGKKKKKFDFHYSKLNQLG